VTALFCDVAGSTSLAERLDPEELREVMGGWFATARAEIEAQGGTVEKYIGDAVMAVFGVPVAHEDDPARALRAALGLRARLAAFNAELTGTHGLAIEIRTGINTGEAVTTTDPVPGEPMVTGAALNAAARLEQLAEPGQILVAERTVRAAPAFAFDDLGEVELRGKEDGVRAFVLRSEVADAPVRGLPGVRAPLVGRDRELDLLLSLQERTVAEGRPHLATIYGDPGVGKSRLVRELISRLRDAPEPPGIHVGRCLSYGEGIAYWPLAEILHSLAGIADDDPAATALSQITALVDEALPGASPEQRGMTTAALAFTIGLDSGDQEFSRLQPSAIRVELQRAWRTILSALAARRPLVLVVEDIHWADPVLLDLLEEIAERAQGRLLVICPSRPDLTDTRPTWGGGRLSFSAVFLAPLTAESANALVQHLLDVDGLSDDVRERILERAEGNPFFLEEILRQLMDQGRIVQDGERWKAAGELTDVELPDTVQAVLAARIDLLEPSQKNALQQASVVGRIFWRGAVSILVDHAETIDDDLRRLEERELVGLRLTSSMIGEEELAFSHILTRDVAYETLPRRERPRAHARVAAWIEERAGDRHGEYVGLLAHHYGEAYRGARSDRSYDPEQLDALRLHAFDLMLQSARSSLRGSSNRGSRALAQAALDIATTPLEEATALGTLGFAYGSAGLGDEAFASMKRAVDVVAQSGEGRSWIALLCGVALEQVCRWSGTMRQLPSEAEAARLLDLGLSHLDEGESEARVRLLTAQAFWAHGYPRTTTSPYLDPHLAVETGEAAAAMADRIGRRDLVVVALDSVQHNRMRLLDYPVAYDVAIRRLEIARTAGDIGELGDSYAVACWVGVYLGEFAEAYRIGREGYDLLVQDAPTYAAHSLSWAALASFYLGEWDRVLAELDLVTAGLGERGQTPTSGFASPIPAAALVHEVRGDRAAADALLAQTAAIENRRGVLSPNLSPLIVPILLLRGEVAEARVRVGRTGVSEAEAGVVPRMLVAEGEVLVAEQRWDDLPAFASRLRQSAAATGARSVPPAADRLDGLAAFHRGEIDLAIDHQRAAADGYDALDMPVHAAVIRLDLADALVAAGRLDEARAALAEAEPPLARVGHKPALERLSATLAQT